MQKQKTQQAAGKGRQKKERAEMKKKLLSAALALALCLTLLPGTALAAEASWAADAAGTLNGIYGKNVFSADDGTMTVAELNTLMEKTGWETAKAGSNDSENLSRGTACEVLADVFDLPVPEGKTAIQYLYDQNIINGKANGDLAESDPVTKAQFAVLTYRVLNSVGGGMGSSTALKPGTKEYFAWMYLAARKYDGVDFTADSAAGNISEDQWGKWCSKAGITSEAGYPGESTTKLEAAVKLVFEYIEPMPGQIFDDVAPGSGFYDGVMYLFDRGIISGNGDGTFAPNTPLPRYQLAVLLARADDQTFPSTDENDRTYSIRESIKYAIKQGYMTGTLSNDTAAWNPDEDADWSKTATREETIFAIMKQQKADTSAVNTAVLDRFRDAGSVSDAATRSSRPACTLSAAATRGRFCGACCATWRCWRI